MNAGHVCLPDAPLPLLLYVENHPASARVMERLLAMRRPDMRLMVVPDAEVVFEVARVHQPAMILMDIKLPGMSEKAVLERLRGDPDTAATPVIAVSGDAMPRDVRRWLAAGFNDYIAKPFDLQLILAIIDRCLSDAGRRAP